MLPKDLSRCLKTSRVFTSPFMSSLCFCSKGSNWRKSNHWVYSISLILLPRPVATLQHAIIGYIKSLIFMASYVAMLRLGLCTFKNLYRTLDAKAQLSSTMVAAWTLLWEHSSRREEITLSVFPSFLLTVWRWLKRRGYLKDLPLGQVNLSRSNVF